MIQGDNGLIGTACAVCLRGLPPLIPPKPERLEGRASHEARPFAFPASDSVHGRIPHALGGSHPDVAMKIAFAILTLIVGTAAFLFLSVFCLAGGANSSPRQLLILKSALIGMLVTWILATGSGIWAMTAGRHGLAIGVGTLPTLLATTLVIVALVTRF